jgi:predicted transcriptional regulator
MIENEHGGRTVIRAKDDIKRVPYSVKLDPDLITTLKHRAVDERKTMGELIEEAIRLFLQTDTAGRTKAKQQTGLKARKRKTVA